MWHTLSIHNMWAPTTHARWYYKLLFWVRNPLEAFAVGSDLRQAIWTAFEKNGIGIPFPQRQVYPMEWPPSKDETLRIGGSSSKLQADKTESAGEAP